MDCNNDPFHPERLHPGRVRTPLAWYIAKTHAANSGHVVVVRHG